MLDCKPIDIPYQLDKSSQKYGPKDIRETDLMKIVPYVEAIGCFMYAMTSICPDLAFLARKIAQFIANTKLVHWTTIKHIFHYIQATKDMGIKYDGASSKQDMLKIQGWINSNWVGNQDSHKSTSGYIFLLVLCNFVAMQKSKLLLAFPQ
jgi:hypothetical protein